MQSHLTYEQRFWSKVEKNGPVPDYAPHLGNCWIWAGGRRGNGYGGFCVNGKTMAAHRFPYGYVPDGLVLDHLCRVRLCVRPSHLETVTHHENIMRGVSIQSLNAKKTHCIHGHEFTTVNTRWTVKGHRNCRICQRQSKKRRAYNKRRMAKLSSALDQQEKAK